MAWSAHIDVEISLSEEETTIFAEALGECTVLVDDKAPKPRWRYSGSEGHSSASRLHFVTDDTQHEVAFFVGGFVASSPLHPSREGDGLPGPGVPPPVVVAHHGTDVVVPEDPPH